MGQKTHPKGFRLVTTERHLSNWYSNKFQYSNLIEEDFYIREKSNQIFGELLSISKIEINRIPPEGEGTEFIIITLNALFPRVKEISRKLPKYFTENFETQNLKTLGNLIQSKSNIKQLTTLFLKRKVRDFIRLLQIKTKKIVSIRLNFIKNPFEDARLIAKYIADQLEKRIPFRKAVKQTIRKVQRTEMKGIKVEVSGRLNGIEIARSEWKRDGRVPLHTLRAKIDYTHQQAETIYGVIGIKVWLFSGEVY
uniref:Small ribosomal subunit protein uS3c n=1 Tax=Synura sphagnicola TaxID=52556 RepID=A0A3G2QZ69_9STRA|nr:ribosomal protein S3 [Synura sphagnicola]